MITIRHLQRWALIELLIVTRDYYTIIFFNLYIEGDIHVRLIAVVLDYKDIIKQYKPNSTIIYMPYTYM